MKKLNRIFIFILSLSLLTGCKKEFLNLAPLDQGSVNLSFRTPEDANRAVLGVYDITQQGISEFALLTERTTDNASSQSNVGLNNAGGNIRELIFYQFTSENSYMGNMWNTHYQGIALANQLIERIEGITFPNDALKKQYTGEAKFLRAYFYFNFVRFFGGVPLSLSEIKDPAAAFAIKRSTEAEVYEAISKDLLDAITTLPVSYASANLGRITQGAAKALLAKAYLTNKKADLALPLLRQLTTTPYAYRLMGTYPQVFTDNTAESLFEIQYLSGITNNEGNPLANFFLSNDASVGKDIFGAAYTGSPGSGFLLATPDLYNSYEATDTRRSFSYLQYRSVNEGANVYLVRKYYKLPSTGLGGSDDNVIIIRYADVLLMLAEAINEAGGPTPEAYEAVDRVRVRAGVAVWPRNLSADVFKTRLFEERRWELAFEFHRWFDLKRSGKLVETLKAKGYPVLPHYILFPVPRGQVTINPVNVPQNPGY